jgi:hypothetical protein
MLYYHRIFITLYGTTFLFSDFSHGIAATSIKPTPFFISTTSMHPRGKLTFSSDSIFGPEEHWFALV